MIIGIPRERKTLEKRVAVTPDGVRELLRHGHRVLVEKGAGAGSFFTDEEYRASGGTIVETLDEVWERAEMVVKVKEPDPQEYRFFRPTLTVFDYLHLAGMPELTRAMLAGGVCGIAYELVRRDGRLPLLEPMSEVAGKLSVINGASLLLSQNGGRGVLLGGTLAVAPGNTVIVGAGIAGRCACEMALGLGSRVTVFDTDVRKLDAVKIQFQGRAATAISTPTALAKACATADLLIGAVLVPGAAAPRVITREIIKVMPKGSVFIDISIDQGGCAETSRATALDAPTFIEEGVIHYGVCNMPAQTPRTSTMALTAATLPYILILADGGVTAALKKSPELLGAVNTWKGKLTSKEVGEAVGIPSADLSASEL